MSIIENIVSLLTDKNEQTVTSLNIHEQIVGCMNDEIQSYLNFHSENFVKNSADKMINTLLYCRIFSEEIWESIYSSYTEPSSYKFRISAIGKLFNRALIATDENINLLRSGYGISAVSNLRLIIECLAISKYIWIEGEIEADRFQDYSVIQSSKFNTNLNITNITKKYDSNFEKDFGWMTKIEYKSIPKLLSYLGHDDYINLYKLSSYFVHASSFTNERLIIKQQSEDTQLFPLEKDKIIELNNILLNQYGKLMLEYFTTSNRELYNKVLDVLSTNLLS